MQTKVDKIILERLKSIDSAIKACKKTLKDIENQCSIMSYITIARSIDDTNPPISQET